MKLATTTENLMDYHPTPAEAVRLYASSGFRLLDLSFCMDSLLSGLADGRWKDMIKDAAETAGELGLSFVQAHSPPGNALADDSGYEHYLEITKRSIEACGMLGIPNIVVHAGCGKDVGKEEFFERNRLFYRDLFPEMEATGVNVLIENMPAQHAQEYYYAVTGKDMMEFIRFVDHPMFHAVWDTGHGHMTACMTGQSQREHIIALGDELYGLHVHGNNGWSDGHLPPFVGGLDIDDIMPALLEIGYNGAFTFEASYATHLRSAFPKRQDLSEKDEIFRRARDISVKSLSLVYEIGRCLLEEYGCFEG